MVLKVEKVQEQSSDSVLKGQACSRNPFQIIKDEVKKDLKINHSLQMIPCDGVSMRPGR